MRGVSVCLVVLQVLNLCVVQHYCRSATNGDFCINSSCRYKLLKGSKMSAEGPHLYTSFIESCITFIYSVKECTQNRQN